MAHFESIKTFLRSNYALSNSLALKKIEIGLANENYVVESPPLKYVFRRYLHSLVQRKKESIELELGFMDFLGKKGIKVPKPVSQKNGSLFSAFEDSFGCMFEFAEGNAELQPDAEHCFLIAKEAAKIRKYSREFISETMPSDTGVKLTFETAGKLLQRDLSEGDRVLISEEMNFLQNTSRDVEKGFIHGDIFPDNVLFKGSDLSAVLDFGLCYFGEYLLDLTNILCSWCFTDDCFDFEKAKKTIDGYAQIVELPEQEKDLFYDYTRLSTFRVFVIRKQITLNGQKVVKPGNYTKRVESLQGITKKQFDEVLFECR